jgi:hypothetical protein
MVQTRQRGRFFTLNDFVLYNTSHIFSDLLPLFVRKKGKKRTNNKNF